MRNGHTLIPVGSRVQVGNTHKGRLVAYFTADRGEEGSGWSYIPAETDLYGVVELDAAKGYGSDDYRCANGTYITMLVVHWENLHDEVNTDA